ncbi:coatomer subunit beta [Medicago truncatula]|uniref:Coatomer subunit beta n=1 Tax=Medicago truncatula TaxID=3880 RepID=G7KQD7_MEDTR|nr:coatomer subunit beta [Medicago truncatula]
MVESLIHSILSNPKHCHPFVCCNAVFELPIREHIFKKALEIIEKFLESQQDPSCKRNAFFMPFLCARDRVVQYLPFSWYQIF